MSTDLDRMLFKGSPSAQELGPDDILKIIKRASECGVLRLEYQSLRITFKNKPTTEVKEAKPGLPHSSTVTSSQDEQQQVVSEEQMLLQETLRAREFEMDQMAILDPLKYEELEARGELEDNADEGEQVDS